MSSISSPSPPSSSSTATVSPTSYFQALARRRQQKKMSITQTYYLAHTARKKLTREASRSDHDLRLLVGHANLLDSLMLDLADAEQEQERWFNQTVSGASKSSPSDAKHVQWAETVVEDPEGDWDPEDVSDADSDLFDEDEDDDDDDDDDLDDLDGSDLDEDDVGGDVRLDEEFAVTAPIVRKQVPSSVTVITSQRELATTNEPEIEYDDEEDLEGLTLTRVPSRQSPPPDLASDSDGESEDDAMPPSPPQPTFEFSDEKESHSTAIPIAADTDQPSLFERGYYVPNPPQGPIIEAY